MKTKLKRTFTLLLAVLIISGCFSICSSAAGPLKYVLKTDGIAYVKDCDETAVGIITIPSVVTYKGKSYKVKYIDEKAFESCTQITSVSIPEGITSIGSHAFRDCTSLKNVYIPESLVICQPDAFEGCNGVTVHCYTSNYQFFTVYGLSSNIKINIIDAENDSITGGSTSTGTGGIGNILELIKTLVYRILELFGVLDKETLF